MAGPAPKNLIQPKPEVNEQDVDVMRLPSGIVVKLTMPNMYAILATVGTIPNPMIAAVLDLLVKDNAFSTTLAGGEAAPYVNKVEEIRGMYAITALCLVEPVLVLDRAPDEAAGEIGPQHLNFQDVESVYWGFFRGRPAPARFIKATTATPDAERVTEPSSASRSVSPTAE